MSDYEIELRKNAAANGRMAMALLCLTNLVVGSPVLAVLAILPIAGAILLDLLPESEKRNRLAWGVYIFAALVAIATFFNAW